MQEQDNIQDYVNYRGFNLWVTEKLCKMWSSIDLREQTGL